MRELAGEAAGERGLLRRVGVAVDHALAGGPIQTPDCLGDAALRLGALRRPCVLEGRPDLRAYGAIPHATTLVLPDSLHSRLRIRHPVIPPLKMWIVGRQRAARATDRRESCLTARGFTR